MLMTDSFVLFVRLISVNEIYDYETTILLFDEMTVACVVSLNVHMPA